MTALLASVRSAAEARIALAAGADVIDLKDPAAGALGALSGAEVVAAVAAVAGRVPVSATIGDDPAVDEIHSRVAALVECGVDIVKVGIAVGQSRGDDVLDALRASIRNGAAIVVVLAADDGVDPRVLPALAAAGVAGAMLDTRDKTRGSLRDCVPEAELDAFVARARALGLVVGLAGSLRHRDIAPLLALGPDYLGFRGLLCAGARRAGVLDARAVAAVRTAIPRAARESIAIAQGPPGRRAAAGGSRRLPGEKHA
ncbi:MAG: (5-formylfuran-3-yl)methyl phosphate synthase [Gammaproteobacteria bacterium]